MNVSFIDLCGESDGCMSWLVASHNRPNINIIHTENFILLPLFLWCTYMYALICFLKKMGKSFIKIKPISFTAFFFCVVLLK